MKVAEVTLSRSERQNFWHSDTALVEAALSALKWNAAVPTGKEGDCQEWVADPLKARSSGSIRSGPRKMPFGFLEGIRGLSIDITLESHVMPQQVSLKIFDALTRNAQIDACRITVTAHDLTVALSGSVRSWPEREEVEAAAWSAPGVTAVENQIRVTAQPARSILWPASYSGRADRRT